MWLLLPLLQSAHPLCLLFLFRFLPLQPNELLLLLPHLPRLIHLHQHLPLRLFLFPLQHLQLFLFSLESLPLFQLTCRSVVLFSLLSHFILVLTFQTFQFLLFPLMSVPFLLLPPRPLSLLLLLPSLAFHLSPLPPHPLLFLHPHPFHLRRPQLLPLLGHQRRVRRVHFVHLWLVPDAESQRLLFGRRWRWRRRRRRSGGRRRRRLRRGRGRRRRRWWRSRRPRRGRLHRHERCGRHRRRCNAAVQRDWPPRDHFLLHLSPPRPFFLGPLRVGGIWVIRLVFRRRRRRLVLLTDGDGAVRAVPGEHVRHAPLPLVSGPRPRRRRHRTIPAVLDLDLWPVLDLPSGRRWCSRGKWGRGYRAARLHTGELKTLKSKQTNSTGSFLPLRCWPGAWPAAWPSWGS